MLPFKIFRIIFGLYLIWHFANLIPWANELFGTNMPYDPTLGPTYNSFPNLLNHVDATWFLNVLTILSFMLAIGFYHQIASLFLWYGWACLINRNVLISNPGMPYVGWLLLACALISPEMQENQHESTGFNIKKNKVQRGSYKRLFWIAWFLMAMGYTASGLHKVYSPSWIDGTALRHVLEGPLARNNFMVDLLLASPPILLKMMTWISLTLEIAFLPLGVFWHTRFWFWMIYIFFHLGIISVINFTDLTLGVFMIHLFTFESRWLKYPDLLYDWYKKQPIRFDIMIPGFIVYRPQILDEKKDH